MIIKTVLYNYVRRGVTRRSSSQNTYVTVEEADDEGRPLGRHLDNICEESDSELRQ